MSNYDITKHEESDFNVERKEREHIIDPEEISYNDWANIEGALTYSEQMVSALFQNCVDGKDYGVITPVWGYELNEKGKATLNKTDKIRWDQSFKKLNQHLQTIQLAKKPIDPYTIGKMPCIELRGIALTKNVEILEKTNDSVHLHETIIALIAFVEQIKNYSGPSLLLSTKTCNISSEFKKEVAQNVKSIIKRHSFDIFSAINSEPVLVYNNRYNQVLPDYKFSLRPNQKQIFEFLNDIAIWGNPFLIQDRSTVNSGKTVSVAMIAMILAKMNLARKENKKILFVCNSKPVRLDVMKWCHHSKIPIATARLEERVFSGETITVPRISPQKNVATGKEVVIVCKIKTANMLLDKNTKEFETRHGEIKQNFCDNYVLIADDITMDIGHSDDDAMNCATLLTNMPKHTVLMSATLPNLSDLKIDTKRYEKRLGVMSTSVNIPCVINTFDGVSIMPHHNATGETLPHIVNAITNNPFLRRMYSFNLTRNLHKRITDHGIELFNITDKFKTVNDLSGTHASNVSLEMIDALKDQGDNSVIKKVCRKKISDDENEDAIFKDLLTNSAHLFKGMGLIAASSPLKYAMDMFKEYIDEMIAEVPFEKYQQFCTDYANFEKTKENIECKMSQKTLDNANDETFEGKKGSKQSNVVGQLHKLKEPEFDFPARFQINTINHITHYSDVVPSLDQCRVPFVADNLAKNELCNNYRLFLLFLAGVGVISRDTGSTYNATVAKYAKEGKMAYIVADTNCCYGVNYPFTNVFVTDEFASKITDNTLFQLFGRAGRSGYVAVSECRACVSNTVAKRLLKLVSDPQQNVEIIRLLKSIDAINAKIAANNALLEKEVRDKQRRHNIGMLSCVINIGITENDNSSILRHVTSIPEKGFHVDALSYDELNALHHTVIKNTVKHITHNAEELIKKHFCEDDLILEDMQMSSSYYESVKSLEEEVDNIVCNYVLNCIDKFTTERAKHKPKFVVAFKTSSAPTSELPSKKTNMINSKPVSNGGRWKALLT